MMLRVVRCAVIAGCLLALPVASHPTVKAAETRADEFVQMIVKLIGDHDKEFRAAGLEQVRTAARGVAQTQLFAAQLPKLDPAGQIALLDALADRGDRAARAAALDLSKSSTDENVRAAAIAALGKLGEADDVPLLVKTLSAESAAERAAARRSLIEIPVETVNQTLAADLLKASPTAHGALIEVLATRRARDQLPALLSASVDENARVRRAAMAALGQLGSPEQIARMLPGVLKAHKGYERDDAEKNVALVCSRIENVDQRGDALIDALNTVDAGQRDQLLSLIGRVGGKKLVDFVAVIATGPDSSRRLLGIEALSKWPDASVADKLFEIANQTTDATERDQAFRAYVKVAAARDGRSDNERLARLEQGMKLAKTPEDVSLVINRVRTAYDVKSVRFVLPYVDQPQFSQIACETIVEIAHHREVRDPNKAEVDKALDKVIATSKDSVVVDRANRYKRGETWQRPSRRSGK
jgi:HEAT repeat protein